MDIFWNYTIYKNALYCPECPEYQLNFKALKRKFRINSMREHKVFKPEDSRIARD